MSDKLQGLNQSLNNVTTAVDNYIGAGLGIAQANTAAYSAIANTTQALLSNTAGLKGTGAQALSNQSAFQNMAGSLKNVVDNMMNQHKPAAQIVQDYTDLYNQLMNQLKANPQLQQAVQQLLDKYNLTPTKIATELTTSGYEKTVNQIDTVQTGMDNLKKGVVIPISVQNVAATVRVGVESGTSYMAPLPGGGFTYGTPAAMGGLIKLQSGGITNPAAGFMTTHMALVGEDGSGYPEYVIPTNPSYRQNALKLFNQLSAALTMAQGGLVGYQSGGLLPANVSITSGGGPWQPVMLPPPPTGGSPQGSPPLPGRPTLNIEQAVFQDRLDMDVLMNQLDFHYQMRGSP
jgi:hypothetical protein